MSRQLRTLLKQNRLLEEKIFYLPRETDWRKDQITTAELSEALTFLSSQIIENNASELSVLKLINKISKIDGRPLPAFEKNALQVVEILFNFLREYSGFTSDHYHVLNSLQLAFTRLSLNDLSFLDNDKHVAVKFLEKLLKLGSHFDKDAGKLAQFLISAIELLTDRLANQDKVTNDTFVKAKQKLDEYFDGFNDKASANINRIFSETEKNSRVAEADQHTQQLIKSKTNGEEMPIFLLDFFDHQIADILHKTISQYGSQSKQCQQLLTDMDTLTWSITCPIADAEYKIRFEADVSHTMKRLYQLFEHHHCVNEYVREFFVETEDIHNKKLEGKRINYDVMISSDIFSDEIYDDEALDSWLDEPKVKNNFDISILKEGHWYHITLDGITKQTRLLMINQLTQELIFINLSGELIAKISFDEAKKSNDWLMAIKDGEEISYRHATKSLIRELSARLEILKNEYQTFKRQQADESKKAQEQEESARIAVKQRIEEDKLREAIRHQKELQAIAKKQAQEKDREKQLMAKELEAQREQEELSAKQRFFIKGIFRKLVPGVGIAYKNDEGRWKEATLTLISKTTQRYIFADVRGAKLIEPNKQELHQLIESLRLKIVSQTEKKYDPMQSLVKQRRQKLGKI